MKRFISGFMFAAGMAIFGKGMYDLGVQREQRKEYINWRLLEFKLKLMLAILDEVEKRQKKVEKIEEA